MLSLRSSRFLIAVLIAMFAMWGTFAVTSPPALRPPGRVRPSRPLPYHTCGRDCI